MSSLPIWLRDLGATSPVVAAPMAGGPTTPELVLAAAQAGSLGFVAGGYLSGAALEEELARVRAGTELYGVNLFAPNPVPIDRAAYAAYRDLIAAETDRYGVELPAEPVEDDDDWQDEDRRARSSIRHRSCRSPSASRTPRPWPRFETPGACWCRP